MLREDMVKEITRIFDNDILISFKTHEKCPPGKDIDICQTDLKGKHQRCMPCWEDWLSDMANKVSNKISALVIAEIEKMENPYRPTNTGYQYFESARQAVIGKLRGDK